MLLEAVILINWFMIYILVGLLIWVLHRWTMPASLNEAVEDIHWMRCAVVTLWLLFIPFAWWLESDFKNKELW